MPRRSFSNIMRSWKLERASVHKKRAKRPRSNKFSGGDTEATPTPHSRKQIWVGGYTTKAGIKIKGYVRRNGQYRA